MAVPRALTKSIQPFRSSCSFVTASYPSRLSNRTCRAADRSTHPIGRRSFTSCKVFQEKKYTEDHEWIDLSDDGSTGTVGISKYAADALGDVVYVELPTIGLEITAGDTIGAVESVKSASDIMTPISGVVTEANSLLEQKPGTINKAPESDGWIAKIQIENKREMESLMSPEEYKQFTDEVRAEEEADR